MPLWTQGHGHLFKALLSVLWGLCPEVELLELFGAGSSVLTFLRNRPTVFQGSHTFLHSRQQGQRLRCPHVLASTCWVSSGRSTKVVLMGAFYHMSIVPQQSDLKAFK